MATQADFTEEEWKTMQKGVTGAGMLVSIGDKDFSDSFGEAGALARYLAEQRDQNESELMRELAHVRGSGFGFTASQQEVETETVAALGSASATLVAKAPDETVAYRPSLSSASPRRSPRPRGRQARRDRGDRKDHERPWGRRRGGRPNREEHSVTLKHPTGRGRPAADLALDPVFTREPVRIPRYQLPEGEMPRDSPTRSSTTS